MPTSAAAMPAGPYFDLYSPLIDSDPFPFYARLREEAPAYWCETGNLWILTRFDDVARATQDWETFSSLQGNLLDEIPGRAGATLGSTDPPQQGPLRHWEAACRNIGWPACRWCR